ncbi:Transposase, type 1,Winged helix-turn-helix DNA-binding domain [Cinara cedri]|uniref:Transposase, type 1,Winged helix-turn-helix DNA-binding domain n=1 Tax=Cinara cedri TaxID=506608 RepID=A0A5E4MEY6_9HEMI|nr:Transposase, type 1,Winged helix-turn-helix DNA-binding domain [Cinara cedri]
MIVETYGERYISERTCREWFHKFKNDADSCRTQRELANLLGVTQHAISHRLKCLGMIQKLGHWVPYELKPRDIERRLFTCEQLQQQNRKGFLHRIVIGDEKWIHYENPKRKKSWELPGHSSTSTAKPNIHGSKLMLCIWWDKLDVVCYELLQPGETITGALYRTQLIRLSRALKEKRPQYSERHDKIILLHDNARPHVSKVVKTYLETLKSDILPHPPYSPDIAPSDFYLFRVTTHDLTEQHFRSYAEAKNWIDSWIVSKDEQFFQKLPQKWQKVVASDGKYFEE